MVEDDTFTKVAKTDMKIRIVGGFIFGLFAVVVSVIFIIVSIVFKKYEMIAPLAIMVLVGILVSISCGYFMFRKGKKEEDKKEQ